MINDEYNRNMQLMMQHMATQHDNPCMSGVGGLGQLLGSQYCAPTIAKKLEPDPCLLLLDEDQ